MNSGEEKYTVRIMPKASAFDEAIQKRIQSEIESFRNQVELANKSYFKQHNKKTKELKARLEKYCGSKKRFLPLEEYESLCKERKILDCRTRVAGERI